MVHDMVLRTEQHVSTLEGISDTLGMKSCLTDRIISSNAMIEETCSISSVPESTVISRTKDTNDSKKGVSEVEKSDLSGISNLTNRNSYCHGRNIFDIFNSEDKESHHDYSCQQSDDIVVSDKVAEVQNVGTVVPEIAVQNYVQYLFSLIYQTSEVRKDVRHMIVVLRIMMDIVT